MDILFTVPGSARTKRQRTLEIIRGERHDGNGVNGNEKPVTQQVDQQKIQDADSIV